MDYTANTPDEFIDELKKRLSGNPGCGVSHYNLGSAYVAKGRLIEAEAEFLQAVECSPNLAEGYVQLGGLALNKGDLDGCLEWNEKACRARPLFAVPFGNIGFVHLQRGDVAKAEKSLRRAVKIDPKYVQALGTLGSAMFMKGDVAAAEHFSVKALEIEPMFGPALNNLALVAMEQNDFVKAKEFMDRARETGFEPHPGMVREIEDGLAKALRRVQNSIRATQPAAPARDSPPRPARFPRTAPCRRGDNCSPSSAKPWPVPRPTRPWPPWPLSPRPCAWGRFFPCSLTAIR